MRRTKEEASRTRASIVDAGLACFDRHGIAGTTMEQIATAAGVTKGAVYHHFDGKQAILHELREQVTLPFLDEADTELLRGGEQPALARIEGFLLGFLDSLEGDERTRRALLVMQFKCEYVDALAAEMVGIHRNNERLTLALEAAYKEAKLARHLARGIRPELAALETLMVLSGLVRLWLVHGPRSRLRRDARAVIRAHVDSRRVTTSTSR